MKDIKTGSDLASALSSPAVFKKIGAAPYHAGKPMDTLVLPSLFSDGDWRLFPIQQIYQRVCFTNLYDSLPRQIRKCIYGRLRTLMPRADIDPALVPKFEMQIAAKLGYA